MRDHIDRSSARVWDARALDSRSRGQGLTEFALVLPVFLLTVLVGLDFGRAFVGWVSLQQSVRIGANFASTNATAWDAGGSGSSQTRHEYQDLLLNDAQGILCDFPNRGQLPDPQFPGGTGTGAPAVVTISCPFHLITPLVQAFLPSPFNLVATASFPVRTGGLIPSNPGGSHPVPVPSFTTSPTPATGTAPLTVQFTDTSSNTPTAWYWAFGDGSVATIRNPSHTYFSVGTYTVTLCAYNLNGPASPCSSPATRAVTVTAGTPGPTAAFTFFPTSGQSPLFVQFTDTSTNGPTSWSWTFGDGGVSSIQNPTHTYNSPGTYTISLTVDNAVGPPSSISHTLTVSPPMCIVPSFINMSVVGSSAIQAIQTKWTGAGFTGQINWSSTPLPTKGSHKVTAQNPIASPPNQLCTSSILLTWS